MEKLRPGTEILGFVPGEKKGELNMLIKPRGRPKKYATAEEAREAQKLRVRKWREEHRPAKIVSNKYVVTISFKTQAQATKCQNLLEDLMPVLFPNLTNYEIGFQQLTSQALNHADIPLENLGTSTKQQEELTEQ